MSFTPRAEILNISPPTVQNGEQITITGRYFGVLPGTVWLNLDEQLALAAWDDGEIRAQLTGSSGPALISIETASSIVSNTYDYEIVGDLTITLAGFDPAEYYTFGNLPELTVETAEDADRVVLIIDGMMLVESTTYPFDDLELPLAQLTNGSHMIHARAYRRTVSANSNSFSISTYSLVGDINGDGTVDESDRDALEPLLGMDSADPDFKPWFDTNDDGVIDELDLAQIGYNFGNTVLP